MWRPCATRQLASSCSLKRSCTGADELRVNALALHLLRTHKSYWIHSLPCSRLHVKCLLLGKHLHSLGSQVQDL